MGVKRWYDAHVMPRLITLACGQKGIEKRRRQVVPLAEGNVFELGCGGGLNQALYDSDKITGFAGIDPHEKLLEGARERARAKGWDHDIRQGVGEDIPFATSTFDTAVCTYTLCTVDDPAQVLSELRRILKPGGKLLFLEHGKAPDENVAKWQERIEPAWKPLAGGCHLTRPIGSALRGAGFEVEPIGQAYLDKTPKVMGWMEWGVARRTGA
ncbi:class I SAM-dependent methyltransferase [Qipengyuania sp. 1NDW9]|uniref:class I SAM-dependent methyltransferase n=1 Tax=Qipengyuania TaxID=1855416 RepID=UPI001C87D1C2|nr:class I SAM-dependent methyltransferase [Qipengyuania aquimaris]MBX7493211.1 class I SAM-dependent methyltransferase [Qipengyuania xiapuensis]MBY6128835.1 class I SAM-dependent methyltransferase [Qipengyuania aquimaris]